MPLSDIEIARQAKMQPIENVAAKIGISRDQLLQYGPYKAKLSLVAVKEISKKKPGTRAVGLWSHVESSSRSRIGHGSSTAK